MSHDLASRTAQVQQARARLEPLYAQVGRVIIGQRALIDRLVLGPLTGGRFLPEAQVDRFMLKLELTYPSKDEELAILQRMARIEPVTAVEPVLSAGDVFDLRRAIDEVYLDDKVKRYIVDLVHATRRPSDYGL